MSRMTSVVSLRYTLTALLLPAGTMAALALMRPSGEFMVEISGWASPAGQTVI